MASSSSSAAAPAAAAPTAAFDALSLSPNEREHPCWGCGKPAPPLDQKPFGRCDLCAAAKYAVCARFCSNACLQKHRLRHKEWHEKKDAGMAGAAAPPHRSGHAVMQMNNAKQLRFGDDARAALISGVDKVAAAVKVTVAARTVEPLGMDERSKATAPRRLDSVGRLFRPT